MINYILKAKHWQIVRNFFIIAISTFVPMMILSEINKYNGHNLTINTFLSSFKLISELILYFVFMVWFWAICTRLNNELPKVNTLNLKRFNLFFYIHIIVSLVDTLLPYIFSKELIISYYNNFNFVKDGLFISFEPIQILSNISYIYIVYFSAKTIKTIELNKDLKFREFRRVFFLILFFPVGIWFIQPRINKIYSKTLIKNNFE